MLTFLPMYFNEDFLRCVFLRIAVDRPLCFILLSVTSLCGYEWSAKIVWYEAAKADVYTVTYNLNSTHTTPLDQILGAENTKKMILSSSASWRIIDNMKCDRALAAQQYQWPWPITAILPPSALPVRASKLYSAAAVFAVPCTWARLRWRATEARGAFRLQRTVIAKLRRCWMTRTSLRGCVDIASKTAKIWILPLKNLEI